MTINPYEPSMVASMVEPLPEATSPTVRAKKRLSRPATALIIMSSCHSVLVAIGMQNVLFGLARVELTAAGNLLSLAGIFIHFVCLILIAVGAAKMGFLESYALARLGALLACIPVVTPFWILGVPFGIWSLRLLADAEIQAAFQLAREERSKPKGVRFDR